MLTKTSTMRTSSSTTLNTSKFFSSAESNRSPKTKIKKKNGETKGIDSHFNLETEIVVIKKERTSKKSFAFAEEKTPAKTDRNHYLNLNKKTLKYYDEFNNEILINSILKKGFHVRRASNYSVSTPKVINKKTVKFADEVEASPTKPLAQIIKVESYRNYNIYGMDRILDNDKPEEEAKVKAACQCSCIVF